MSQMFGREPGLYEGSRAHQHTKAKDRPVAPGEQRGESLAKICK